MSTEPFVPSEPEASAEPVAPAPAAPAEAGAPPPPEGFRTPEAILAEKDQEIAVLKDRLLRLQAEFENYKKRQSRERAESVRSASADLLREFLPILDNLERALASATDEAQPAAIRTGIEMILRLFRTTLEKSGVTPMDCLGKPFDPNWMHAVLQVESPGGEEGRVVEVIQQGYLLEGRVLRPAMVNVARAPRPAAGPDADP